MKNILLITFCVINLFASGQKLMRSQLIIEFSVDELDTVELVRKNINYDSNGRIIDETSVSYPGSDWTYFRYLENGKVSYSLEKRSKSIDSSVYYYSQNSALQEIITYKDGVMSQISYYNYCPSREEVQTYGVHKSGDKYLISATEEIEDSLSVIVNLYVNDGDIISLDGTVKLVLDNMGNVASRKYFDANGNEYSSIDYTYENGRIVSELIDSTTLIKYVYYFDHNNTCFLTEYFLLNGAEDPILIRFEQVISEYW